MAPQDAGQLALGKVQEATDVAPWQAMGYQQQHIPDQLWITGRHGRDARFRHGGSHRSGRT